MFGSIFFCSFLAYIFTTTGIQSSGNLDPEDVRLAFKCNPDKVDELNWQEVEQCEEKYADLLAAMNILPDYPEYRSRMKFYEADFNGDGTLTVEEALVWFDEEYGSSNHKDEEEYKNDSPEDRSEEYHYG
eukprot:GFUD01126386.1.p1 GENE.GFUD01126386.1~~GFUD01126386.1.p1  ORF type:complete len:130 (+),score=34.84 GFUD01126386.1:133-522(+)